MKNPFALTVIALLGALSLSATAEDRPGVDAVMTAVTSPGKATIAEQAKITATVEAIDVQQRRVILRGPKGKAIALTVGPDVRNLDQVKVGDRVVVRYVQALTLTLQKNGTNLRGRTETEGAARSPAGDLPGGAVGQQVEVIADVIAVNAKTHMVTLRGPQQQVDLKVRDAKQLQMVKVGDQVKAVYTEALALSVEPMAPAKK
jgi:hypothetical protein